MTQIKISSLSYPELTSLANRVAVELSKENDPRTKTTPQRLYELRRAYQRLAEENRKRLWITRQLNPSEVTASSPT
jgi:hypothetical protein